MILAESYHKSEKMNGGVGLAHPTGATWAIRSDALEDGGAVKGTGVAVATGLAAFVALGAMGGAWLIERTLTTEAAQALAAEGVEATVVFSGRMAVVSTDADQLSKAIDVVRHLPGVTVAEAGDGEPGDDLSTTARSSAKPTVNTQARPTPVATSPSPTPTPTPSPSPEPSPSPSPTPMPELVIQFEGGEATLPSSQRGKITQLAEWLAANPEARIQVIGHTDNGRTPTFREELSQERADAVAEALVNAGAQREQLTVIARADKDPAESNATAEGRTANRRVTFTEQGEG